MSTTIESPRTQVSAFNSFEVPRYADVQPEVFVPRDQMHSSLLAAEADTLGWDCVNAIRLPQVNAAMLQSDLYPKSFDTTIQEGWSLTGSFGPWSLVRGGSGSILFLRTPLTTATMRFPNVPDLQLTGGRATVAIKLQYLPQPPAAASGGDRGQGEEPEATREYLASDVVARSADDPAVVIQSIDYGDATPNEVQKALFAGALADWFNANLDQFTYVFTVVNLNARAAKEQFQWLKPTYSSYAYFNGADDDSSYFGVLNMTSDNSPDGLTNQLPPSAIPSGCDASVLISNQMFLRQMILPGLTKTFSRATVSDFTIRSGGVIEALNTVTLDDIRIDALSYTPQMLSFKLQTVGDQIQIDTKTQVNVSPGIDVFITATEYYTIKLIDKEGGGQTLDFVQAREPKRDHWLKTATWITVTEILIGIAAAIASTVAGKLIQTLVRRIIAIVIIALVAGLAAAIPEIIAMVMEGKAAEALPSIGDLVAEASGDVEWPNSSGLVLSKVELNGSLQLGGQLQPAQA